MRPDGRDGSGAAEHRPGRRADGLADLLAYPRQHDH